MKTFLLFVATVLAEISGAAFLAMRFLAGTGLREPALSTLA